MAEIVKVLSGATAGDIIVPEAGSSTRFVLDTEVTKIGSLSITSKLLTGAVIGLVAGMLVKA